MNASLKAWVIGAAVVLGVCVIAPIPAQASETFFLDARKVQSVGDLYAGPASSTQLLLPLLQYKVTVDGAVSVWSNRQWNNPARQICGAPLSPVPFPTLGVVNGPVSHDAAGRFAILRAPAAECPPLPDTSGHNFQLSTGGAFSYLTPSQNLGNHTYTYTVVGQGKPLEARFFDPAAYDNYGRFRITVSLLGLL